MGDFVRRTFAIESEQDARIEALASASGLDKSRVVVMMLDHGLPGTVKELNEMVQERLSAASGESIKNPGAKRRRS